MNNVPLQFFAILYAFLLFLIPSLISLYFRTFHSFSNAFHFLPLVFNHCIYLIKGRIQ